MVFNTSLCNKNQLSVVLGDLVIMLHVNCRQKLWRQIILSGPA